MKKLRLKALSLGAREILSREQLRIITGGADGSGSGCTLADCPTDYYCDQNDNCVNSANPGSGTQTGSGEDNGGSQCGSAPDGHGGWVQTCPTYSAAGHNFTGCVPC